MEIILARHGRPQINKIGWITPRQLVDWIAAYNESGVFVGQAPSDLRAKADSFWIVSSPLLRCVQSAKALSSAIGVHSEEVFSEAALPHPFWRVPWLPASVWVVIFRAAWFCGYSGRSESFGMAKRRAKAAAARLIVLAREHHSVLLVGHGIMAALIAKQLIQEGWLGPRRPVHGFWQFSVYRKKRGIP